MTALRYKVLFLLFILSSCNSRFYNLQLSSKAIIEKEDYYFTYAQWESSDGHSIDTAAMRYYSHILRQLNEPGFYFENYEFETYRFIVGRTFQEPVVLRLENRHDHIHLFWQEIIKGGPGALDEISDEKHVTVDHLYWSRTEHALERVRFWEKTKETRTLPEARESCFNMFEGWKCNTHKVVTESHFELNERLILQKLLEDLLNQTDISNPL